MAGGKITGYLDCVSPYSYFALLSLDKNRALLERHGVEIDIIPVFLGNKPPWTLPAKGAYSSYDSARAKRYFGVPNVQTPSFFPILSLLPQRALGYIKEAHPDKFISVFLSIYAAMWQDGQDVSKPELLFQILHQHFSDAEVDRIMKSAKTAPYKQLLNDKTKEALDRGAFGCPWFIVRNAKGEEEPFFGSDRRPIPLSTWSRCMEIDCRRGGGPGHVELTPPREL
ncbi:similar to 2-hydroxychromene-2-carboxylate isomerase [Plenodomus lingam JN3]|uniref:Glutathione S-transferase kappa n=1 Tax=Leptosphaeria maculans (strain JN3 / isolate v23.1.3 / race Av1-4-5-6-7-8) TaxID=985895 RepID=E4ZU48_LEPMJ|nr:similar to 2-hydroxychromene-2-carboxylate isomerase [Plenodomus lingam JN3]CBX94758.1 similar to 2-hydroxychromene-2-carboxylate isomerase [Plenodomus lingam JN3]